MTIVRSRVGWGLPAFAGAVVAGLLAVAALHLTQGTAAVGGVDLLALLQGRGTDDAGAVLVASRLPRLAAGVLVGVALATAGAALQSVTRNPLASPDTLAVNAGAHIAIVGVAAFGITIPVLASGAVAFVGGLIAAVLVLALSSGGGGPIRLVLAGSALAIGLMAIVRLLLIFFPQETQGLYKWGEGSLAQIGMSAAAQLAPVVAAAFAALLLLARRLDILSLGDDQARVVGIDPQRTRVLVVVLAVLLSAAAVTLTGPIGFVGLCAPAIVRLLARRIRGLQKHRALLPLSALVGVALVLGADVLLRIAFGAQAGVEVPTGVVTTVLGAVFLIVLALRFTDSGSTSTGSSLARLRSRRAFALTVVGLVVVLAGAVVAAALLGDAKLLLGDVANWLTGRAGDAVSYILGTRMPRVAAALLAGAAMALAGAIVQGVTRNALADPSILGVTGGAGLAAIGLLTLVPMADGWLVSAAALIGATVAGVIVFGLSARGGLGQNRLVLIGFSVSYAALALITLLIVLTDPWNETKALTWMSGSTYGRTFASVLPLAVVVAAAIPALAAMRRDLDLLGLDDDTPRLLGVRLGRTRLLLLAAAVVLTATATASVGVIGFVGLIAPHAARMLAGGSAARMLPTAALLGAALVSVSDTIGRTVLAPDQIPAGIATAVLGTPYFAWLLWRARASRG